MAEQVQAILDDMVAPLADLQTRGIFTAVEIEQIVARRREFEYRLRRRQPRQSDYLQYLETEEKLEELRRLRTRRLNERSIASGGGGDSGGGHGAASHTNSKHIGDVHGIKFLHLLWIRTLRQFRTVEMYLSYAQFCTRVQSYQRLTACYQDALSFFPHSVDLWIGAASHEYFGQQSIRAARILLQRALRIHAGSAEVWIQYFTLELHWRCKLLGRNKILRQGDDPNETNVDAEGALIAVAADAEDDARDNSRSCDNASDDPYGIAKLVYTEAIKSKAATPELPWQFVAACQDFPVRDLQMWIVQGLTTHTNEDTWIIHAKYLVAVSATPNAPPGASGHADEEEEEEEEEQPTKRLRTENPVLALLEQACNSLPTRKMFVNAIRFLDEYLEEQQIESEQQQKVVELQNKLFADATHQGLVNNELIQLQVDHLPSAREAIALLETYTTKTRNDEAVDDGDLWIKYASLVLQEMGEPPAAKILETALTRIPMNKSDYVVVLVQLLGVRLLLQQKKPTSNDKDSEAITKLVQRLLLLSPAHPMASSDERLIEQVVNAPAVLDLYLEHLVEKKAKRPPMIIESILASKCMDEWVAQAPDTVDAIIDKILMMEESDKKKQEVVFERAIRIFKDTPLADLYRRRRDDELRYRVSSGLPKFQVPSFMFEAVDGRDIESAYNKFQVCLVKAARTTSPPTGKSGMDWKAVESIFARLGDDDKASWCVENNGSVASKSDGGPAPTDFLSARKKSKPKNRAYCSFLVQKDKTAYESTLQTLPFTAFPNVSWMYEPAIWFFFGRNPRGTLPLEGRAEHTDSVSHDGTWHYQLSGRKKWYLRPTTKLLKELPEINGAVIQLECNEGDVLLVNTRLWFHRTEIPPQDTPSVSYARDFRICTVQMCIPCPPAKPAAADAVMTNVDGLYATEDITAGCVIFTEDDMPDCALHRSSVNPNCELVALDESGREAIVSLRDIKSGEFFCIVESSSDESSEGDEDDVEDNPSDE